MSAGNQTKRWATPGPKIIIVLLSIALAGSLLHGRRHRIEDEYPEGSEDEKPSLLDRRIVAFHCENMPLEQYFSEMGRRSGVPLMILWDKIETDDFKRQTPITLTLRDVSLRAALSSVAMQRPYGPSWLPVAEYAGAVVVGRDSPPSEVRAYDVSELVLEGV